MDKILVLDFREKNWWWKNLLIDGPDLLPFHWFVSQCAAWKKHTWVGVGRLGNQYSENVKIEFKF